MPFTRRQVFVGAHSNSSFRHAGRSNQCGMHSTKQNLWAAHNAPHVVLNNWAVARSVPPRNTPDTCPDVQFPFSRPDVSGVVFTSDLSSQEAYQYSRSTNEFQAEALRSLRDCPLWTLISTLGDSEIPEGRASTRRSNTKTKNPRSPSRPTLRVQGPQP